MVQIVLDSIMVLIFMAGAYFLGRIGYLSRLSYTMGDLIVDGDDIYMNIAEDKFEKIKKSEYIVLKIKHKPRK